MGEEKVEEGKGKDKGKGKDAKGKDAKGKDGKKGKGKDKGGEEEEEKINMGPTDVVKQFVEHINNYTEVWEAKDESNNFEQRHDRDLARKIVYPIVESKLRGVVDDMMKDE